MAGTVSPVYIGDHHTIAGSHAPGLIRPTAEGIPLIFHTGRWVQHHLISRSNQWFVQRCCRRNSLRHSDCTFHLRQLAKFLGDTLRIRIRWEIQCDKTPQIGNIDTLLLRHRLCLRCIRLRGLKARFGSFKLIILENLVKSCEIGTRWTCDLRKNPCSSGSDLRPYPFAEFNLYNTRLKCRRWNGARWQVGWREAINLYFLLHTLHTLRTCHWHFICC